MCRKKMFYNIIFCPKNLVGNKICSTFALAIGNDRNYIAEWSSSVARRAHNPEVAGSNPVSATKFITVVDTISTTVTFYFSPPEKGFPRKTGVLPNIPGNKRSVCPDLLRPWWENPGLSKTAIVIRVETINDYFPYINPLKAEMLRWALDGFSFITVWQKGLKGQNRASIILTNLVLFLI